MEKRIAVVIADENEFMPLETTLRKRGIVQIEQEFGCKTLQTALPTQEGSLVLKAALCGIGKVNAASAAAYLIITFQPDAILNIGLSGGLAGVNPLDIVVGTSFIEADFDLTPLGYAPGEKPSQAYRYLPDAHLLQQARELDLPLRFADFGCGDQFLAEASKKQYCMDTFSIAAFDMESAAIAAVCHKAHMPFLSIRQISDGGDENAALAYTTLNDQQPAALSEVLFQYLHRM